jgi:hypothetical protein
MICGQKAFAIGKKRHYKRKLLVISFGTLNLNYFLHWNDYTYLWI